MKNGLLVFTMGAVLLGMTSMANAGQPLTLTNDQMDNVTAGATANAINSANTAAVAQTGNSSGHSTNIAVAVNVTVQNAISVALGCGCSANHIQFWPALQSLAMIRLPPVLTR
jgi:hypothetical protein